MPPAPVDDPAPARRRRGVLRWTVAGVVVLAVALVAGLLVLRPGGLGGLGGTGEETDAADPGEPARPVTQAMLLGVSDVTRLAPRVRWRETSTTDNTGGDGINTVCQTSRFADPDGEGTLVRAFAADRAPGEPTRQTLLQTVEISQDARAAAAAYDTTLEWFAGCQEARLQLLGSYRVSGLGQRAQLLRLRVPTPDDTRRTYVVGLARSGSLTVSTVAETTDGPPVGVPEAVATLTTAVRNLCRADASGPCPTEVRTAPVLPPPSGETPGTLAAADLPAVGRVDKPWVGTRPVPARPNNAATTCDESNFVAAGAGSARSRTYLIPQADLPRRFGVTQTWGRFPSEKAARAFVARITRQMARCEDDDLSAQVSQAVGRPDGFRGSSYALWRLDSEIRKGVEVGYWMGVARVGRYVTQVLLTPVAGADVDADVFEGLVARARDRLFELQG